MRIMQLFKFLPSKSVKLIFSSSHYQYSLSVSTDYGIQFSREELGIGTMLINKVKSLIW